MKLDIACGQAKREGFVGIDQAAMPGVDVVHDLLSFPWPIELGSVDEARCIHYFEHVPAFDRPRFMSEVWRVLADDAGILIVTPMGVNRSAQDFTHQWPPVVLNSYLYFDRDWLRAQKLDHYIEIYGINCNFRLIPQAFQLEAAWEDKSADEQAFAVHHYANAATDLIVTLQKRPL